MKYSELCGHFIETHFYPRIEAGEDFDVVMVRTQFSAQTQIVANGRSHLGSEDKLASLWLNAQTVKSQRPKPRKQGLGIKIKQKQPHIIRETEFGNEHTNKNTL